MEIDSWISSAGKNGMRRDWDIRDARSGRTISKATRLVSSFTLSLFSRSRSTDFSRCSLWNQHVGDDKQTYEETFEDSGRSSSRNRTALLRKRFYHRARR